ncbi:DUF4832 domain-containing protein [Reichenbachiella agarivorans]|uniref:DUF4832 domain-containing protein n=1 Tax=Reichenbachiella agarivorans TaxID=2979464 RepID=A0ABY6CNY0_9BACT|nr:DUF4832 domain-containing protein [Reichenbachiella agarivorans]UXP32244.1 DUF4832 domain-containing protein [Reichenbachiella agarivorans]
MQKSLIVVIFFILTSPLRSNCQSVTYQSHSDIISNPERGFYHHTETHSANYNLLSESTLASYQQSESITQILRVFYLEDFRTSPISEEYLNNIRKDFSVARNAGIKCIIRFAYTTKSTSPYNDAKPEIVQTHIAQLKPIFQANADVIAVMQAGFIGAWGEWYYTDHFSSNLSVTEKDWENRRQVVFNLLDALSSDRFLQIRTPGYKMKIFDSQEPLDESTALSNTYNSRLGHHNDCFVASSSDFGTYVNPDVEKPYLNQETLYTPMGGETCALASPYSDCDNSSNELARFHWSYLNRDYNTQVLNEWDSQGCFDEITLKLGYRYELISGTFTEMVQPSGTFSFNLNLQNIGYANPYNPREIEIILRNQDTSEEYLIKPEANIRLWPLGENINLSFTAGIPAEAIEGSYDLLLNLPDSYETLHDDPRYSIQMANTGVWESNTGYNNLAQTISISSAGTQPLYTGDMEFKLIGATSDNLEIEGSSEIFGTTSTTGILVYWGRQNTELKRIIQRSENAGEFTTIAATQASEDYYLDANVESQNQYTYRYYLVQNDQKTAYSDEITLETSDITTPSISIDGQKADWGISPLLNSATHAGQAFSMRVFFDVQNLNILMEGPITQYEVYINSDLDGNTGYQEENNPIQGADYFISNQTLYRFINSQWSETEAVITTATTSNITEISLNQKELENLGLQTSVSFYSLVNNGEIQLSSTSNKPSIAFRALPPDLPSNITVKKSELMPKSRLLITWEACTYCTGYTLERSLDQSNYIEIGRYNANTIETLDDNLENETTYFYRMTSFNNMGSSTYSEPVSGTTGETILKTQFEKNDFNVYPNPTTGIINLSKAYNKIFLYSISGTMLRSAEQTSSVDLSQLQKGVYILVAEDIQTKSTTKVIKL